MVEKIKTYFMFSKPPHENRAVYEIMWKNVVEQDIIRTLPVLLSSYMT